MTRATRVEEPLPGDPAEVAEAVRRAADRGSNLVIAGNGTRSFLAAGPGRETGWSFAGWTASSATSRTN